MSPNDKEDLAALVQELVATGRKSSKSDTDRTSFKDGADVVYKLIGIAVVILGLVLWLAGNRSDINTNKDAIIALKVEISVMRADNRELEGRVRVVEQEVAKLRKYP